MPYGQKLCKISTSPYQSFRWKAGPQGRYKETIISFAVAKERNICQTCLNDMKYGLPVGVRDALLAQPDNQIALPMSDVGQRYFYEQQAQHAADGQSENFSTEMSNMAPSRTLDKFSRAKQVIEAKSKTAFRNLPKMCSFWFNGTCTRVLKKTCPFRPCCGAFAFPEIAGTNKEICNQLVADLERDGPAVVMKTMDQPTKDAIRESLKGNREEAIRKRVSGTDDDLSNKYLGNMKTMHLELTPPEDPSCTTLWFGNVEPDISEGDLREVIYPYGHIQGISMIAKAKCAFVQFASREMAENAARELYRAMMVRGRVISVNWAKPRAQAHVEGAGETNDSSGAGQVMLPPPGMEGKGSKSYYLPGLSQPYMQPPPPNPEGFPPASSSGNSYFVDSRVDQPQAADNPGQDPVVGNKRPVGEIASEGQPSNEHQTGPPPPQHKKPQHRPPGPSNLYPSMNPARMGAKI
eukprot:CAMPEP_0119044746 /NCGR_PEP_ID=MMETSP1177-20130426/34176_1 /TAXON_ID=2985 /ORGANISM="Ochromonas sp, Strain CCMP1899" /LENGTH=463 /DNA_ID=CAMNT_0007015343 /DNA_START=181 /DNA_END=1572 /DNA_ORIENTATION=-